MDRSHATDTPVPDFADGFAFGGLTIRRAGSDDLPALTPFINRAFAYQDAAKGDVRIDENGLRRKIETRPFYVWTDAGGTIVACCYLKVLDSTLYFGMLGIADDYRGGGLAPWLGRYYERYDFTETGVTRDIGWTRLVQMQKPLTQGLNRAGRTMRSDRP